MINGEGADDRAAVEDRGRPAGAQAVLQRDVLIVGPQRVVLDIGDIDRLADKAAVPQDPAAGPISLPSMESR